MNNKLYDWLKIISLIFLPIAELITAILQIWNVPYTQQITATLVAINTCLGAIVVIANKIYSNKLGGEDNNNEV